MLLNLGGMYIGMDIVNCVRDNRLDVKDKKAVMNIAADIDKYGAVVFPTSRKAMMSSVHSDGMKQESEGV